MSGLLIPAPNIWGAILDTHTSRPAGALGATITPGNNAMGSWVQVATAAQMSFDVWMIDININSNNVSTAARDALVDIGIDPAGGTSYTVMIQELLASCASPLSTGFGGNGINYRFPLHIPAGASVAARASVNNGTVGTCRVFFRLYGKPSQPDMVWKGQRVQTLGTTPASSSGTSITAGTTSDGTWTSLGTLDRDSYWFQTGMGCNDGTMASVGYGVELSTGSTAGERILIPELRIYPSSSETMAWPIHDGGGFGKSGDTVWGRCQVSSTADSLLSMAAWAVS